MSEESRSLGQWVEQLECSAVEPIVSPIAAGLTTLAYAPNPVGEHSPDDLAIEQ